MSRVRFTANFDYKPKKACTIAYLAGMEMTVKRECAEQAIAAGKAVPLGSARKVSDNGQTKNYGASLDGAPVEDLGESDNGSGDR